MKYEAIRTYSQEFKVGKMCKVLNLTKGSYYQWQKRMNRREDKNAEERKIVKIIESAFEESRRTYGYRRMSCVLSEVGVKKYLNIKYAN